MVVSMFSVAILLVFFSVAAVEVYKGIKNGFRASLISLATTVSSIIISTVLSLLLAELVGDLIFDLFIRRLSFYQSLVRSLPSMSLIIDAVIRMIASSFLFSVLFFIVRGITHGILALVCRKKLKRAPDSPAYCEENGSYFDRNGKTLSVIVSSLTAVLVTMVITSPVMGTLDVAKNMITIINKTSSSMSASISEAGADKIISYADDLPGNVFYQLGGKLMYYGSASTNVYGDRAHLISEVEVAVDVVDSFIVANKAMRNPTVATEEHVQKVYELCDDIEQLKLFNGLLADVLSKGSAAWQRGNLYFGIAKPATNRIVEPAFDEILSECRYTDVYSAKLNAITVLKAYAVILDSGIARVNFSDLDAVMNCVKESRIITRVDAILDENPYMEHISVSSIAMSAVSDHIFRYNYNETRYGSLMEDMADALNKVNNRGYATQEEKARVLASYAKEYIGDYGFEIPDSIASSVAEELLKSLNGIWVSADDVRGAFGKYSD